MEDSKDEPESESQQSTMIGLYSWGSGTDGQLGQGRQLSKVPKPIQTLLDQGVVPVSYSCGEKHAALAQIYKASPILLGYAIL